MRKRLKARATMFAHGFGDGAKGSRSRWPDHADYVSGHKLGEEAAGRAVAHFCDQQGPQTVNAAQPSLPLEVHTPSPDDMHGACDGFGGDDFNGAWRKG